MLVGVEAKKVRDLLESMATGRLAATQLPRLMVDYNQVWLLVIGEYRAGTGGVLSVKSGKGGWHPFRIGPRPVPIGYVESFIIELQTVGVHIKQVESNAAAAEWIRCLHRFWSKKWEDHKALLKFDKSALNKVAVMPIIERTEEWRRQDQIARAAATLPGIGYDRAWEVARTFPSIRYMANAELAEWQKISGIGKVLAKAAMGAINGD